MGYDLVDVHNADYIPIGYPLTTLFKKVVDTGIGTGQDTHMVNNDRLPQIGARHDFNGARNHHPHRPA
jgi:hypothetical protein